LYKTIVKVGHPEIEVQLTDAESLSRRARTRSYEKYRDCE
jgi:hypothetical protein